MLGWLFFVLLAGAGALVGYLIWRAIKKFAKKLWDK